jgi:hypothetical protein
MIGYSRPSWPCAGQFCQGVDRQAGPPRRRFEAQAWQDDPAKPIASAFGHFIAWGWNNDTSGEL